MADVDREALQHPDRMEQLAAALDGVLTLEVMMYRHMSEAMEEEFGGGGRDAVRSGTLAYGRWRGERMRQHHLATGIELSARELLEHWTTGDVSLLVATDRASVTASDIEATLTIEESPEWTYFASSGRQALGSVYYSAVYDGIAQGYHPRLAVEIPSDFQVGGGVPVRWRLHGKTSSDSSAPVKTVLPHEPAASKALVRRTVQNRGALFVFLAREVIRRYDVAGEHTVREGIRRNGAERGAAQRERHLKAGRPLTLRTLMDDFDVPTDDAWEWRDEGYLSDGVWFQDCTFCPHIPIWKELDALDLGYIYDVEIHQAQFRAYNPETRVQWETLQTRGARECRFRFEIPSLRTPADPHFIGRRDRGSEVEAAH